MSEHDRVVSGLICDKDIQKIREAVCVQTEKVYDACKEKDCIEDAPVIFRYPACIQKLLRDAINVKCRKAEVIDVYTDVEPVPFKRGFYTVDVKFFIKVWLDFFVPGSCGPCGTTTIPKTGCVVFDKKVFLFGSDGGVKIFKSRFVEDGKDEKLNCSLQQNNLPIAKVEVAEPIALNAKIQSILDKLFGECLCIDKAPRGVMEALEDEEGMDEEAAVEELQRCGDHIPLKRVVVTLGLFSIIKLVRFVQLLLPAFDFCVPNKKCVASTDEDPCELFETIDFPVDEFFPPQKADFPGAAETENKMREEMD